MRHHPHLVDRHQLLCVGNSTELGSGFKVIRFGELRDLHRVRDSQINEHQDFSHTEMAAWLLDDLDYARVVAWNDPDPATWMAKSAELRDRIYPENRELYWSYGFEWRESVSH